VELLLLRSVRSGRRNGRPARHRLQLWHLIHDVSSSGCVYSRRFEAMTKVVILLGAGATVADVATRPRKDRPPLDRRFFAEALLSRPADVAAVARYVRNTYEIDILSEEYDRLEGVMGLIYTDLFNPTLESDALSAFRRLLQLFTRRLASTTNSIPATNKRLLYRMIAHYLSHGVRPQDLTLLTFNQDIQVEKMLALMSAVERWKSQRDQIFSFPHLYSFASAPTVSQPAGGAPDEQFDRRGDEENFIRLLKLHGSLNWYSSHSNREPSRTAMFAPDRAISITRRKEIDPAMTLQSTQRSMYTLPVVVPPVSHKSSVLHRDMSHLWQLAERRLRDADDIVVFGYSCPISDVESSNQLRRSQARRSTPANFSVIDPSPSVAERYIRLTEARCLHYYASGHSFLEHVS